MPPTADSFLEALQATKIKSEVLGYTTNGQYSGAPRCGDDIQKYGRTEKLMTYVFKEFDEPLNVKVKKRISSWRHLNMANNCDPENVKIAHDRLAKRPEQRKILFVLNDGAVGNLGSQALGIGYLKDLVKKITRAGRVEIYGIGLHTNVGHYYPNHINIYDDRKLAETILDGIKKVLNIA